MADALLGSTVQVLVEKAIHLASEQIGLFFGFKKDFEKLKDTLTLIQAVLDDAEEEQVKRKPVKLWLEKLERVAFDAENLLDDFKYEMIRRKVEIQNQMKRKVCFFFSLSNPIAFRCKMAHTIQKINMDLISINEQASKLSLHPHIGARDAPRVFSPPSRGGFIKDRQSDGVTIDTSFVGRDDDVSAIVTQVTTTGNNETISALSILGMGGIGKTTLARNVFNHAKITERFEKRMWVCVSDDFNVDRLFRLMLESLQEPMPGVESRDAKANRLKELLNGKKYLLVLDDVWNKDSTLWNDFLGSLKGTSQAMGSWILVTTREQQVATSTRISSPKDYSLKQLSDDQCWRILQEKAFIDGKVPNRRQHVVGSKIAQKCGGLPLAASVLGGMLRNKETAEWETLESRFQSLGVGEIDEILKLSFDRLPYPSLKKCLAYCSIFPKDFEMKRSQLIQLWAAEGFLHSNSRNNMCMEEVGNMYFTILLDSNLFQDAEEDEFGDVLNCKMHDLVHDMVQSISNSKTLRLTESRNGDEETFSIRHLALERSEKEMPFPWNERFKCITTLFLWENRSLNDREMSFFMLRALSLRSSSLEEFPKSIGKLTHLRYFDLSNTSIKTMSDSFCRLYNLQTIRVGDCESLTRFPNNFENLVNLRHFELRNCRNCKELPTLGHMPSLKSLHFEGLDGITSIGPSFYGGSAMHSGSSSESPLKLFPALEHFILRDMQNLTEWTEAIVHDGTVVVFPVLEMINIDGSPELATFPRHFPRLKKLRINQTKNGSAVMAYFCSGVRTLTSLWIWEVNGLTQLPNMLFQNNPSIARLCLLGCEDLTQFLDFPFDVPQTSEGPNAPTESELSRPHTCIDNNTTQHLIGLESLETLSVFECPSLKSISIPKGNKYLTALRELQILYCRELTHLSIPQMSESESDSSSSPFLSATCPPLLPLEELGVYGCSNLIFFPIDLTRTPSLSSLSISECEKLTDLPKGKLCSLTSLRSLDLGPFPKITTELHSFLDLFDALQPPPHPYLPSLSQLYLWGWPHWDSLPDQLQHLSALTDLTIIGFGVKSLPDWFGKLSSLEELCLRNCEKLENLPSHQSMRSLTRLRGLQIDNCPLLKERCKPESNSTTDPNSEWSKISQISKVEIDWQQIRG